MREVEGGWSMGDLVQMVLAAGAPDERVDRMIEITVHAAKRKGEVVDAMFASWGSHSTPRFTDSVEDVRSLAASVGIATTSMPITYGFSGEATCGDGGKAQACGFNAASAEVAALLICLRRNILSTAGDLP